ncbi:2OG-Fe(II) oxygenase [Nostoc parmelioides]|nr:2OG-Fe(II) oxygenase [Nostoc parmelioides]
MRPDIRNNERVILDDNQRAFDLWQRVSDHIPKTIGRWQAIGLNERFRFYRYDPGQRFAIHHDGSYRRPNGEESLLTFMIYLNEGFEGGETRFHLSPRYYEKCPNITVVPVTGMALCFVHDVVHEGVAVVQGRKYVLRSDVMYRQQSRVY